MKLLALGGHGINNRTLFVLLFVMALHFAVLCDKARAQETTFEIGNRTITLGVPDEFFSVRQRDATALKLIAPFTTFDKMKLLDYFLLKGAPDLDSMERRRVVITTFEETTSFSPGLWHAVRVRMKDTLGDVDYLDDVVPNVEDRLSAWNFKLNEANWSRPLIFVDTSTTLGYIQEVAVDFSIDGTDSQSTNVMAAMLLIVSDKLLYIYVYSRLDDASVRKTELEWVRSTAEQLVRDASSRNPARFRKISTAVQDDLDPAMMIYGAVALLIFLLVMMPKRIKGNPVPSSVKWNSSSETPPALPVYRVRSDEAPFMAATSAQKKESVTWCPFCAEEIRAEARKCKHCGEWLKEDH